MGKTRNNILDCAKSLFNSYGYSEVTIRMIALDANLSSGNLNYHFKKKVDILEALYFEMVQEFDKRAQNVGKEALSMEAIVQEMRSSLVRMYDYRFFWTDLYNILRTNGKIKTHFIKSYQLRYEGYNKLFYILYDQGIMLSFEFENERNLLIDRMIGFSNTIIYNSFLYRDRIDEKYIVDQADTLLIMLFPYLTAKGKKEFKSLYPGAFS